jgi:hypothetical protein
LDYKTIAQRMFVSSVDRQDMDDESTPNSISIHRLIRGAVFPAAEVYCPVLHEPALLPSHAGAGTEPSPQEEPPISDEVMAMVLTMKKALVRVEPPQPVKIDVRPPGAAGKSSTLNRAFPGDESCLALPGWW